MRGSTKIWSTAQRVAELVFAKEIDLAKDRLAEIDPELYAEEMDEMYDEAVCQARREVVAARIAQAEFASKPSYVSYDAAVMRASERIRTLRKDEHDAREADLRPCGVIPHDYRRGTVAAVVQAYERRR
jgi:hypothetical protein